MGGREREARWVGLGSHIPLGTGRLEGRRDVGGRISQVQPTGHGHMSGSRGSMCVCVCVCTCTGGGGGGGEVERFLWAVLVKVKRRHKERYVCSLTFGGNIEAHIPPFSAL